MVTQSDRIQATIDDQVFVMQQHGGISRYFTELLRAFRDAPELGVEVLTPFRYVVNDHLLELDPQRFGRARLPQIAQRNRVLQPLNRIRIRRRAVHRELIHHTYYLAAGLQLPAARRLCTIYDMTPELFPDMFPYGNPHAAKDGYVQACDAIACISQTTKNDLLRHYGELDKPVVVTPLAAGQEFFTAPPPLVGMAAPYVLYVGQRVGYKNFDVSLRALARLAASRPTLRLVCAGGPPFDAAERIRIDNLGLTSRVEQRAITDGAMPGMYSSATCLVFPSRYEGFGLPTVEAFAAGCPVVLADTPCSVEIGGAAAQYFSPDDDEALAEIIDELAGNPVAHRHWTERGRLRGADFTWRRTAELTRDLYRQVTATGS